MYKSDLKIDIYEKSKQIMDEIHLFSRFQYVRYDKIINKSKCNTLKS